MRLAGDTAYGSAEMLQWLVHERGIEPHIPVFDKFKRADDTFSRSDFAFDARTDTYRCPSGKQLKTTGTAVNDGTTLLYRASKHDYQACVLKPRFCPKDPARKVPHSIYEGARGLARDIATTEAYAVSRRQRKKVEMLSPTSRVSCAWIDYAFEVLRGLATNSFSLPPLKTSESSPS